MKIDWTEWDEVVGYKLKDSLVGKGVETLLTENQWAKQFIESQIRAEVEKTIQTHNLLAIATGKKNDQESYNKQTKKWLANLIENLEHQRKSNDKVIGNLKNLII